MRKANPLEHFERIARAAKPVLSDALHEEDLHAFDRRNIHPALPPKVRRLFDDGYYEEATFTAFKYIDKKVQAHSGIKHATGFNLMMDAFDEKKPKLKLTLLVEMSEIDEQRGYRYMFAGSMAAVRNPRGHEVTMIDDPDTCLDHLAFASLLLRRLEKAGYA